MAVAPTGECALLHTLLGPVGPGQGSFRGCRPGPDEWSGGYRGVAHRMLQCRPRHSVRACGACYEAPCLQPWLLLSSLSWCLSWLNLGIEIDQTAAGARATTASWLALTEPESNAGARATTGSWTRCGCGAWRAARPTSWPTCGTARGWKITRYGHSIPTSGFQACLLCVLFACKWATRAGQPLG